MHNKKPRHYYCSMIATLLILHGIISQHTSDMQKNEQRVSHL